MAEKVIEDIELSVRQNVQWQNLSIHLRQVLHNNQRDYEKYVFNYSLKNQLRFRGNLVSKVFRHEQRYYELLVQKSINGLCLFPYHLADIVSKGLRVTPFNYYLDVLSQLLRSDKSYDTLPNFTAADCLRVIGIGRNEYLSLIGDLKTHSSRSLIFGGRANPIEFLPRFPIRIRIEPWWRVEVGYVLESDIRYVNSSERALIDDLIDFGSQTAGSSDYDTVHSLYRKGLLYIDVPISGEDRISIPPLRNFVMNRVSGDYFENLLYKIFVSADEHMTISELAQMLQVDLDGVKQAVSLICRLGFAHVKETSCSMHSPLSGKPKIHSSWQDFVKGKTSIQEELPQITPLNYNEFIVTVESAKASPKPHEKESGSLSQLSSDGNYSDFSFANISSPSPLAKAILATETSSEQDHEVSSELEELSESTTKMSAMEIIPAVSSAVLTEKTGKRVGFLFDSTLTAFLMMGNLSPGLKNHAVTMFEVGKLCEESIDTFLTELEKVSLLDAEGEGDVSRYFAHAVILRSTICSLRHILPGGFDLLRLECLECLDQKTRDRVLEKKYKLIISAAPLTASLSYTFNVPFFGQFFRSSDCSHMWTKLFYNHLTGYGPPSLFLCRGTVLKTLPRILLGYGKLLVNILHSDSYIISSENFRNINDQLKNGCVLIQGYGIRAVGELRYEAFPFEQQDARQIKWTKHRAVLKLRELIDLDCHCGYITFLNTGVPDFGCDVYELAVHLHHPKRKASKSFPIDNGASSDVCRTDKQYSENVPNSCDPLSQSKDELFSPMDGSEVTSFARATSSPIMKLKSPDENYFAVSPQNSSPSNVFTSEDCSELLASELAKCEVGNKPELVSQGSVEIPLTKESENSTDASVVNSSVTEEWTLLDVHFGVPLFDVDCNTRICQQLVRRLCGDENLQQIPINSLAMNNTFQRFVKQCLYFEEEEQNIESMKIGKSLPYPRINLAFENGRVCYWNGR